MKNKCYDCVFRRDIPGDAHSMCAHPAAVLDSGLSIMFMMQGGRSPTMKRLNLAGNRHGFRNGWFMWPLNFDPVWLESCDGFEAKEEMKQQNKESNVPACKSGNVQQSVTL